MPWLRTFIAICAAVLVAIVVALVLLVSFVDLGMSGHGITAMFIGVILTALLAMVLMGLIFLSDRNGSDQGAYIATSPQREEAPGPRS